MLFARKVTLASTIFTALLLGLFLFQAEARADVLEITSGSITIGGTPNSRNAWRAIGFNFAGNNFSARGGVGDGELRQGIHSPCSSSPCGAGAIANPNASATLDGIGQATFNGTTTDAWWFAQDSHLFFTGTDVVIPDSTASTLTLTSAFTMTGSVFVYPLSSGAHLPLAFSTEVSGSGIATLTFQYFANLGPGGYILSRVSYDFTPVPEPATLFLLGTGLAGLLARRRRANNLQ